MTILKRALILTLLVSSSIGFGSCSSFMPPAQKPELVQMKAIAELATMECYFHNVAKYKKENTGGIWPWKKDKHFWIEYSGIVKVGVDPSLLSIDVTGNKVTIQIPEAKVLGHKVDQTTLTKDSFIVDKDSAEITAEDETLAFKEAQENMVLAASQDTVLMENARERAKDLLEGYINVLGETTETEYTIEWKNPEGNGTEVVTPALPEGTTSTEDKKDGN